MLAWFNNLKIQMKLLLGYSFILLFMVAIGIIGLLNIQNATNELNSMYTKDFAPMQGLGTLNTMVSSIRADLYAYMDAPENRADIQKAITGMMAGVNETIANTKTEGLSEEDTANVLEFNAAWSVYDASVTEFMKLIDQGQENAASKSLNSGGKLYIAQTAVTDSLNKQITKKTTDSQQSVANAKNDQVQASIFMLVLSVIAIVFTIFIIGLTLKSIAEPVKEFTGALKMIQKGILLEDSGKADTSGSFFERKDEFGDLFSSLNNTDRKSVV
jgi:methyl-accepting chemotaxis protein